MQRPPTHTSGTLPHAIDVIATADSRSTPMSASFASNQNKGLLPPGATHLQLKEGIDGKAKIQFKAKGVNLDLPVANPILVQLRKTSDQLCWEAKYSPPFLKNDGVTFSDKAD